ncbi:MAG TPA: glycoside hydrolase family 3 protein [Spirochaetota bacterium]|nr:glycoside hydrolase family 3 protein [Spirochaetota bacterium]HPV40788.1 glycoside hydrolase family 3 protein [Spirochaetota bacterium]
MKKLVPVIIIIMAAAGCIQKRYVDEAAALSRDMKLDWKIGQMLMMAIPGRNMNRDVEFILKQYRPGGVILFGYNLSTESNNRRFIKDMQKASCSYGGIPLFVSIDQEGGRVVRIVDGVTQFPGNMAAGVCGDRDLAYRWGRALGLQLRLTGVNMNLAPALDVNNNPHNPVINTRSFGSDPRQVSELGAAYLLGLQDSRCMAVGKHFPGHGDTNKDSHLTLPVIPYDMKRLERVELAPFRKAVRAGVEGIMTAHIAYPAILGGNDPATVSKKFLTGILREDFRFKGLVITDDMEMHAIARRQDIGEAAVRSILAGADIILFSSYEKSIPAIYNAIRKAVLEKRIPESRIDESVNRILEAKIRYGIMVPVKGKCVPGKFVLTEEDRKALADADRVNAELSRRGILLFGDRDLVAPAAGVVRVFMTRNRTLQNELLRKKDNVLVNSLGELGRFRPAPGKKTVFYLHVSAPDPGVVRAAADFCRKADIGFVLVSSGNPFPLTVAKAAPSGLLSFSDTAESVRQLGRCLNGEFRPAAGGSLLLGNEKGK